MKEKNIVVYTAIFGNSDKLEEVKKFGNADYICFTDNLKLKSKSWKIIFIKKENNSYLQAKKYKILPHLFLKSYNYSIWQDGTHALRVNPKKLINFLNPNKIAFFKHPRRTNVYQEAREVLKLKKDILEKVVPQIKNYKKEGFFINKLIAGTVIIREHNDPKIINLMNFWWKEINNKSIRDQLSFNYSAWKNKINYSIIPGDVYRNLFFKTKGHLNSKEKTNLEKIKDIFRENDILRETIFAFGIKINNSFNNLSNYFLAKKRWGI